MAAMLKFMDYFITSLLHIQGHIAYPVHITSRKFLGLPLALISKAQ